MRPSPRRPLRDGASEVIVVGGRAAGAATAMLLARAGLDVVVLDRSDPGSDPLSTHALMRGAVLQLDRWGLLGAIVEAGTPPVRRTTMRYGGQCIVLDTKPVHGVDALYAPRRTVLDPVLVDAAVAAGAEVHHRTSVRDLVVRRGRVAGVRATTADGRVVERSAPLVIGADGIRSVVAKAVAAPATVVGRSATAVIYGYWSGLTTHGYEWNFDPRACSGVIPTNGGDACVFVSAPPGRIGRGGRRRFDELMRVAAPHLEPRLTTASAPRHVRTWGGHAGYLRRAHGPGWALVGDAGYFKDPISAHGLTDALRDAELLARAVIDGRHDVDGPGGALARYEDTRDRLSLDLFGVVDRIASHRWGTDEIGPLLVELSAAMVDEVEVLAGLHDEVVDPLR